MNDSRPVLIVLTTSYPSAQAGSESAGSFVQDFCSLLNERARVIVIAPGAQAGTTASEGQSGPEVRRFHAPPGRALSSLSVNTPQDLYWTARVLLSGLWLCLRTAREHRASLLHIVALWVIPCGLWARIAARVNKVGYSTWALGSDIWSFKDKSLFKPVLQFALGGASQRYADGLQLARDVELIDGRLCQFLASSRLLPQIERPKHNHLTSKTLHFLGRWHANKGIDLLLDALALLSDEDWSLIDGCCMAGGGPLEGDVERAVDRLKQQGRNVELRGYLGREDATEFIVEADYLILSSRIESIPVVLSDALQCNTPLIMMPVGDLPELHQQSGFGLLCEEVSSAALCKSIQTALRTKPEQHLIGAELLRQKLDLRHSVSRLCNDIGL